MWWISERGGSSNSDGDVRVEEGAKGGCAEDRTASTTVRELSCSASEAVHSHCFVRYHRNTLVRC